MIVSMLLRPMEVIETFVCAGCGRDLVDILVVDTINVESSCVDLNCAFSL